MKYLKTFELHSTTYQSASDKFGEIGMKDKSDKLSDMAKLRKDQEETGIMLSIDDVYREMRKAFRNIQQNEPDIVEKFNITPRNLLMKFMDLATHTSIDRTDYIQRLSKYLSNELLQNGNYYRIYNEATTDDPLWASFEYGNMDIFEFLLKKGLNPNTINEYSGRNFYTSAAYEGYYETVERLLDMGIDPTRTDKENNTLEQLLDSDLQLGEIEQEQYDRIISKIREYQN